MFGEGDIQTAHAYREIANIYKTLGRSQGVLEYSEKAVEIIENLYGEKHSDLINLYHDLAMVSQSLQNYQQAIEYDLKALDIQKSIFAKNIKALFL